MSLLEGVLVKKFAETLHTHPFMLSRWRDEYREGKLIPDKRKKVISMTKDKKELDRLKRFTKKNTRLLQENDLPKMWQRYLAETHQND